MKFFTVAALLATTVTAMPHAPSMDIQQTQKQCGRAELSCCDSVDNSTPLTHQEHESLLDLLGGSLSGALSNGGVGKFGGCSSLASVDGVLGTDGKGLVGGQCNNHVACCDAGDNDINGLVNVAIPCVPVNVA
ncbi:hypothetical protein BDW62DRAFT_199132 [Aspergillus aurantiobrunneus]